MFNILEILFCSFLFWASLFYFNQRYAVRAKPTQGRIAKGQEKSQEDQAPRIGCQTQGGEQGKTNA